MRISDWSSDVCSSDLPCHHEIDDDWRKHRKQRRQDHFPDCCLGDKIHSAPVIGTAGPLHDSGVITELHAYFFHNCSSSPADRRHAKRAEEIRRSEEHTSVLQSIMRNTSSEFCLNKK